MQTLKLILKIMNLCFCVKYDLEEGQRNAIAWLVTRRDSVIFNKSNFLRLFIRSCGCRLPGRNFKFATQEYFCIHRKVNAPNKLKVT